MRDVSAVGSIIPEPWDRQSTPVVVTVPGLSTGSQHDGHVATLGGLKSAMDNDPFDALASAVVDHCRRHPDAVVVLTGPYGAGHTDLVSVMNREIPTVSTRGLDYIPRVDLLDEDALLRADAAVRDAVRPVLFTAAEAPARYATVLQSQRGMVVPLAPLDRAGAAAVVTGLTGAEPLPPALTFLLEITGGLRSLLVSTVRLGMAEGWLTRSQGRLVAGRSPFFTDHGWAEQEIALFSHVVGDSGLEVLASLAANGPQALSDVMRDEGTRRQVVKLERLGVARFRESTVEIHPPLLGHVLRLSSVAQVEEDDDELLRKARAALSDGLLGNAYQYLKTVDSACATVTRAMVDAANGRPRTAMKSLSDQAETTGCRDCVALREVVRVFGLRGVIPKGQRLQPAATDPQLVELCRGAEIVSDLTRAFAASTSAHLQAVPTEAVDGGPDLASLHDCVVGRAPGRRAGAPASPLIKPPAHAPAHAPAHPSAHPPVSPPADFAEVCALVSSAVSAVVLGHDDEARDALARLDGVDFARLPVLGSSWVIEHLALTRLILDVDLDPVPQDWFAGEPPGRMLLQAVPVFAIRLMNAVARGERSSDLLSRLRDLWAAFETRKPRGIVSRDLADALDFAVAGPLSNDIVGPPGMDLVLDDRRPAIVSVRAAIEAGRLLRCAPRGLVDEWQAGAAHTLPGIRRLLARTVVLRRVGDLPAEVCGEFASIAEAAGVEPEIVALLRSRAVGDSAHYDATRTFLRRTRPALTVPGWGSHEEDAADFERSLRTARLADLTDRERAVVVRVVAGAGTDGIAEALGISRRTVETHIRNAYRKLKVHSRTELRAEIVR